jgi:hypothetical protein
VKQVAFRAWQGGRYIGLWDILTALDDVVASLQWRVRIDEMAPGPGSNRLEGIGHEAWIDTATLLDATANDIQVIDGQVSGYRSRDSASPHVTIRAVDSTWWDVESADDDLTEAVVNRLPNVEPIPQ